MSGAELHPSQVTFKFQPLLRHIFFLVDSMDFTGTLVFKEERNYCRDAPDTVHHYLGFGTHSAILGNDLIVTKEEIADGIVVGNGAEHVPGVRSRFALKKGIIFAVIESAGGFVAAGMPDVDVRRDQVDVGREPLVDVQHFGNRSAGTENFVRDGPPPVSDHANCAVDEHGNVIHSFSGFSYSIDICSNTPGIDYIGGYIPEYFRPGAGFFTAGFLPEIIYIAFAGGFHIFE